MRPSRKRKRKLPQSSSQDHIIDLCLPLESASSVDTLIVSPNEDSIVAPQDNSCLICFKQFTYESMEAQQRHINICLDESNSGVDCIKRHFYKCKICSERLVVDDSILVSDKHIIGRLKHVKACAKIHGIEGPEDLELFNKYDKMYFRSKQSEKPAALYSIFNPSSAKLVSEANISLPDSRNGFLGELSNEIKNRTVPVFLMNNAKRLKDSKYLKEKLGFHSKKVKVDHTPNIPRPRPPKWKKIIGSEFVVDGFKYHSEKYYVLTHFHADHYWGLSKKGLGTKLIICTQSTSRLVRLKYKIPKDQFILFSFFESRVISNQRITCLPANHCPGAALFHFRNVSSNVSILHTGDFRYNKNVIGLEQLHLQVCRKNEVGRGLFPIDVVYLDTTYLSQTVNFASQESALLAACNLCKRYASSADVLVLFGTYTIGKEKVFASVVNELAGIKNSVRLACSKAKLEVLNCIDLNEIMEGFNEKFVLTTDMSSTRFHIVSMRELNMTKLVGYLNKVNRKKSQTKQIYKSIVGIRATGWAKNPHVQHHSSSTATLLSVPYSEHSSFSELKCFYQDICKRQTNTPKIIPTVKTSDAKLKMLYLP